MGKKVREYKSGDFIFAKVKGYPAWPARVQRLNGKKYFVYFYGTGETANLPPNQIFDYVENKDKFLTKSIKRKDFNDGARQIEHDFANNVPLEEILGVISEPMDTSDANDTNATADDSTADTTVADTTADETNTTAKNEAAVEDSDEGALIIDESKKNKKSIGKAPVTPKTVKEAKALRAQKKEEAVEEQKKEEEIISRSGRKIRPKRYIDEQTEENATLPSPAPKKKRGASPAVEKEQPEKSKSSEPAPVEKPNKHYKAVTQAEIEDLKLPFLPGTVDEENILIAHLPSGQYVGIKLFHNRPTSYKNEAARLQWDKQAASNAITLKSQLEKGHITAQSVAAQIEMDLSLTDEEKANLDKEREIEEKKSRVQFLKTEMKLIEIDAKIKSCLSLEKADTDVCLKLLDELSALDIKPLMLLKHPTCLETLKRMRAYVGNTPSWKLSEEESLQFSKHAQQIRAKAESTYVTLKALFETPEGLSFWEFFSERVSLFKKATAKLTSDERLEMIHEPIEMSQPTAHTMKSAIDAANEVTAKETDDAATPKKKSTPSKNKKAASSTPTKTVKRQSSRTKVTEPDDTNKDESPAETSTENDKTSTEPKEVDSNDVESNIKTQESEKTPESKKESAKSVKEAKNAKETAKNAKEAAKNAKEAAKNAKDSAKSSKDKRGSSKNVDEPKTPEKSSEKEDSLQEKTSEANNTEEKVTDNEVDTHKDMNNDNGKEDSQEKSEIDSSEKEKTDVDIENDSDIQKNDSDKQKNDTNKDNDIEENDNDKVNDWENDTEKEVKQNEKEDKQKEKEDKPKEKEVKQKEKQDKQKDKEDKQKDKEDKQKDKEDKQKDKEDKLKDKEDKQKDKEDKQKDKEDKQKDKEDKQKDKEDKQKEKDDKQKEKDMGEPRAKRSRDSIKKAEPTTPKSPLKRKLRS